MDIKLNNNRVTKIKYVLFCKCKNNPESCNRNVEERYSHFMDVIK